MPPYLRVMLPSACVNFSKIAVSLPASMPAPVSLTAISSGPARRRSRRGEAQAHPSPFGELERVGQKIGGDLAHAQRIADHFQAALPGRLQTAARFSSAMARAWKDFTQSSSTVRTS